MKELKEVQKIKKLKFELYLIYFLKQGWNPAKICKILNTKKSTLQYHLSSLKQQKIIKKIGYGVWEINPKRSSKKTKSSGVGLALEYKEVRGHGFAFKIPIKTLRNWDKRNDLLKRRNIKFEPIHNKIIRLIYKNHKVWLTSKSIIIFFPKEKTYFTKTAEESRKEAIYDFKLLCNGLFRLIGLNLLKFEYQIIKHHYSLMENELARDYNKKKKKLVLEQKGKVWGLIDNSLNLNEFETISKSADSDNKIVQDFFNDLKRNPATMGEMKELMQGFSHNLVKHFEVLNKIGNAVKDLTKQVKKRK